MYLGVNNQRVRRPNNYRGDKDDEFGHPSSGFDPQSHATPAHHPASAGSLRRHIAASLIRHHQSAGRNKPALQPLSPASYGSSLEMAPYNPAATPDSSIELRGRIGESSYSFKTSTELLKVLNRIWSLEEQHSSNVSLVKGLKTELGHARAKIKELLRDQRANRHEIDQLMKKISANSSVRKSNDHERIDAALLSVRDELENERRLRKRSESLHRKLARELFEVKVALSSTVKEYEKEKNSSNVLEELCDKFAKGIIEYAKQVHIAKQKSDVDWTGFIDRDNLILQMSEMWLDERMQTKDGETGRPPVVEKLKHEIESFLASQPVVDTNTKDAISPGDPHGTRLRRRSLESIPETVTAEDSGFSVSHEAEMSKVRPGNQEGQEELGLRARSRSQSPIVQASDCRGQGQSQSPVEINMLQKSDIYDSAKEQRKRACEEEGYGPNSKPVDKLISELLVSEGRSLRPENECKDVSAGNSAIRRNASPIRQWTVSMTSPDPRTSEASMKMQVSSDSSLKARLQEPKSKGLRSRLKILKGSS